MAKPVTKPEWTVGNPNFGVVTIEPTSGKKENGWTPSERPAPQYMNWLFYNIDQWIKYFESSTDDLLTAFDNLGFFVEAPVGQCNGSNPNFLLSRIPSGDVFVYVDGQFAKKTTEYIFNTIQNRVEFQAGSLPANGQEVLVGYMTNAGSSSPVSGAFQVTGTFASPTIVDPTVGIPVTTAQRQKRYIKSQGGAQAVTANPQIAPGTIDGQELLIYGTDDTNFPTLDDGNGVALNGGPVALTKDQNLLLTWVAGPDYWSEVTRRV